MQWTGEVPDLVKLTKVPQYRDGGCQVYLLELHFDISSIKFPHRSAAEGGVTESRSDPQVRALGLLIRASPLSTIIRPELSKTELLHL